MEGSVDWGIVESDSATFTTLVRLLGVTGLQVEDIWTLEKHLFTSLSPVHGLIFSFKYIYQGEPDVAIVNDCTMETLYFGRQVTRNMNATQALLGILLNCYHSDVMLGRELDRLKDFSMGLDSDFRGVVLSQDDFTRNAHNAVAYCGDNAQNLKKTDLKEKDIYHYISFVPFNDKLYELDGILDAPIDHGMIVDQDWIDVALSCIRSKIASYPEDEIQFSLMAVVTDRAMLYSRLISGVSSLMYGKELDNEIDEIRKLVIYEREKFTKNELERARRCGQLQVYCTRESSMQSSDQQQQQVDQQQQHVDQQQQHVDQQQQHVDQQPHQEPQPQPQQRDTYENADSKEADTDEISLLKRRNKGKASKASLIKRSRHFMTAPQSNINEPPSDVEMIDISQPVLAGTSEPVMVPLTIQIPTSTSGHYDHIYAGSNTSMQPTNPDIAAPSCSLRDVTQESHSVIQQVADATQGGGSNDFEMCVDDNDDAVKIYGMPPNLTSSVLSDMAKINHSITCAGLSTRFSDMYSRPSSRLSNRHARPSKGSSNAFINPRAVASSTGPTATITSARASRSRLRSVVEIPSTYNTINEALRAARAIETPRGAFRKLIKSEAEAQANTSNTTLGKKPSGKFKKVSS